MTASACPRCGHEGPHAETPAKPPHHLRRDCGQCGRFLGFVPRPGNETKKDPSSWTWSHPARARMRDLPPSEAQLAVVRGSEWHWIAPHLRDRDMASALIGWIKAEAAAE